MKNNQITFSQFLSVSFLSSLCSILFIIRTPSVFVIISAVAALFLNFIVFTFYKGQNKKLFFYIAFIYLSFYCVYVVVKFSDYMNKALSYGPACLIIAVLLAFTFFCTVKGFEAVARASTVIAVFVIAGLVYMLVCTFTNIRFNITADIPARFNSSAVLLFPSALYIVCYDNIISIKPKYYIAYSALLTAVILYFLIIASGVKSLYPIQYLPAISKIGVFKGSDCILLSILTVSCMFSVTSSTAVLFKACKHNYLTNAVFIGTILIISVTIEFFGLFNYLEEYIFIPFSAAVITAFIVLSLIKRGRNV